MSWAKPPRDVERRSVVGPAESPGPFTLPFTPPPRAAEPGRSRGFLRRRRTSLRPLARLWARVGAESGEGGPAPTADPHTACPGQQRRDGAPWLDPAARGGAA